MNKLHIYKFDILRALVNKPAPSWFGNQYIVKKGSKYIFAPKGGWIDDIYVTDHPNYLGTLEEILGNKVRRRKNAYQDILHQARR